MKTKTCNKCNIEKSVTDFFYHKGRKSYMSTCKSCNSNYKKEYNSKLKKTDELTYQLRNRASELVRRSKYKNIPYEKKMFHLLKRKFEEQKGKCYYTNFDMDLSGFSVGNDYCFVVDRIDPEKGYVEENIVFCCNSINKIKSSYSLDELRWWVDQIKK